MTETYSQGLPELDRDTAIAYLLDWISSEERNGYRQKMERSRKELAYFDDLTQIVGTLGHLIPGVEPSQGLKQKLFDSLGDQQETESEKPGFEGVDTERKVPTWVHDVVWNETPMIGIQTHTLFTDKAAKSRGLLLNISPGAQYPAHHHHGPEHFFLIEGDLVIADLNGGESLEMRGGDFQTSPTGSRHGRLSSPSGCVALVISSLEDELLEALPLT